MFFANSFLRKAHKIYLTGFILSYSTLVISDFNKSKIEYLSTVRFEHTRQQQINNDILIKKHQDSINNIPFNTICSLMFPVTFPYLIIRGISNF